MNRKMNSELVTHQSNLGDLSSPLFSWVERMQRSVRLLNNARPSVFRNKRNFTDAFQRAVKRLWRVLQNHNDMILFVLKKTWTGLSHSTAVLDRASCQTRQQLSSWRSSSWTPCSSFLWQSDRCRFGSMTSANKVNRTGLRSGLKTEDTRNWNLSETCDIFCANTQETNRKPDHFPRSTSRTLPQSWSFYYFYF